MVTAITPLLSTVSGPGRSPPPRLYQPVPGPVDPTAARSAPTRVTGHVQSLSVGFNKGGCPPMRLVMTARRRCWGVVAPRAALAALSCLVMACTAQNPAYRDPPDTRLMSPDTPFDVAA